MLAMDTATGVVSVALHDGSRVLAQEDVARPQAHAEHLAPAVRAVLARAGRRPDEVTHVVAGTGPGPFTGLRVGLVTAATFGFAVGAQVGGVCSLDAIAHEVWLSGLVGSRVLVATDARRKEVYWAAYRLDESGAHRDGDPAVGKAAQLPPQVRDWPVAGRGPLLYPQSFGVQGPQGASEGDEAGAGATPRGPRRPSSCRCWTSRPGCSRIWPSSGCAPASGSTRCSRSTCAGPTRSRSRSRDR